SIELLCKTENLCFNFRHFAKLQNDVQKFPLRSNFCTSKRGLHPQLCQSVFAVAKTFNTSADWQNSLRKASFQRKLRQSALRYKQPYENLDQYGTKFRIGKKKC